VKLLHGDELKEVTPVDCDPSQLIGLRYPEFFNYPDGRRVVRYSEPFKNAILGRNVAGFICDGYVIGHGHVAWLRENQPKGPVDADGYEDQQGVQ